MGKIHEALEKSGRVKEVNTPPAMDRKVRPVAPLVEDKAPLNSPVPDSVEIPKKAAPAAPSIQPTLRGRWVLDPTLIAYHDPTGVQGEIFKILRTNILFSKNKTPPRVIMVTSAIPGDGKSFVASNLAISIAQGIEEHVLLMDCDIRRSTIHTRFGFADDVRGLSDYLTSGEPFEHFLKKTVVEKLTILPGGTLKMNPAELLSSQTMRELFDEVKNRYGDRYIIVDSPPPQLTAETTALANYVDAIILVVRHATTPRELAKELIEKLGREKIIGVVLNGYRVPTTERYGYGKYKEY